MGTPYSSVAVSGFNSSPPSDDGTQTDANKVYWATIKTKLADPLNTAAAAINSALVAALAYDGVSKASDYTTVAGDNGRVIEIASTVSSAVTITLGQVATVGTNYFLSVINLSTISQTIARGGSDTINKSLTSLTLPPLACVFLQSNASGNGYDIIGSHGVIFGHPTIEGVTATGATGTGALVFGTSPSLTTPTINTAAAVGGTWTAAATWTLPAVTLGGAVSFNTALTGSGSSASLSITNPSAAPMSVTFDGSISGGYNSKTSSATNGSQHMAFKWSDNSTIGSITNTNSTTTAFNTSSDADLKADLGACHSVTVLEQTIVHDFRWEDNGIVDRGVFAQEAYLVKPNAVTVGTDEIDPENGKKVKPWMVDYSKYVPDLIVGWQHLKAEVEALKAEIAALKAAK